MSFLCHVALLSLIVSSGLVIAFPTHGPELEPRVIDCTTTNPESFYDASCWATLDLTNWLNNWHAPNICGQGSADNGVNCCNPNEEWSTCFLRLGKADSGLNCSRISVNTNDCAYTNSLAPDLDPSIKPQVRYILRTIFNINAFFTDWYNALQFATTQASLVIDPIVTAVDPAPSMSISLTDVLTALIAGLPFIGAPAFGAEIAASAAAQAFVTGLQQAPGLVKALYPTGSPESQIIQIGTLGTALKDATTQIGDRINAGLWSLMSDQKTFAAFASSGAFTGDPALSLPQQVDEITKGLELFVLSKALIGNKYLAQIIPVASIVPDARQGICGYKGQDVCFHNDNLLGGVDFILEKTDANDGNHGLSMMQKIIQGGWATPQSLYQGSLDCAGSGQAGQTLVSVGADNVLNVNCLSQLTECYTGQDCPTTLVNGNCPVGKCATGY